MVLYHVSGRANDVWLKYWSKSLAHKSRPLKMLVAHKRITAFAAEDGAVMANACDRLHEGRVGGEFDTPSSGMSDPADFLS
jgi:hypothetical protein